MTENIFLKINKLIQDKKIDEAQLELSKLGSKYYKNSEYLFLRSKIFYYNKLYYLAVDTLLIALEFDDSDKIYNLISKIYNILGNEELSENLLDLNLRKKTVNFLKVELSGIYKKNQ